jgi:hypothetical protein
MNFEAFHETDPYLYFFEFSNSDYERALLLNGIYK